MGINAIRPTYVPVVMLGRKYELLEALERWISECRPGELARWDVERLRAMTEAVEAKLDEYHRQVRAAV